MSSKKISTAQGGSAFPGRESAQNAGMQVFSYIAGGILVWSLIGWGLDTLFHTQWIVLAGAALGLLGGMYLSFAPRFHDDSPDEGHSPARGVNREESR